MTDTTTATTEVAPTPPDTNPFADNPFADAGVAEAQQAEPDRENWSPEPESEAKSPTESRPEPTAQQQEGARRSRKDLAEALDAAEKRAAELEEQGKSDTQRHQDAEAAIADLKKQLAERDQLFIKERAGDYDPAKDESVLKIGAEIGNRMEATVPFLNSANASGIIKGSLPSMLNGLAEHVRLNRVQEFRERLKTNLFTEQEREDSPEKCDEDAGEVFKMLRDLLPVHRKYQETLETNKGNWDAERAKNYVAARRAAAERLGGIGSLNDDEIKADILSPNAVLSGILRNNQDLRNQIQPLINEMVDLEAGPPPLKKDATPQEIATHRDFERRVASVRQNAVQNAIYAKVLPQILAVIWEQHQKLTKRVGSAAPANRPGTSATTDVRPRNQPEFNPGQHPRDLVNPYAR